MREAEIKERMWKVFLKWMAGQTVSAYPDGETDYYDHDVERFARMCEWATARGRGVID